MKQHCTYLIMLLSLVAVVACSNKKAVTEKQPTTESTTTVNVPQFQADSAYQYIQAQADFGPRVPNTDAHKACGDYLAQNWKSLEPRYITNTPTWQPTTIAY